MAASAAPTRHNSSVSVEVQDVVMPQMQGAEEITVGAWSNPGLMYADQVCNHRYERNVQAQVLQSMDRHVIEHRMNGDDDIGLHTGNQAQQAIVNQWCSNLLDSPDSLSPIAHMKNSPKKFGVIANCRPIQFDSFAQGEMAVIFEHIDDLNAICWQGQH